MSDISMSSIPSLKAAAPPTTDLKRAIRLGALTCAFLIVGLGGWASVAELSGAVIAPGTLSLETQQKKVQHPTGGIVAEIHAENGKRVTAGDLLMRLDQTMAKANLGIVESQLQTLTVRQARLQAEQRGTQSVEFPESLQTLARTLPEVKRVLDDESMLFESRRSSRLGLVAQLREKISQTRDEIGGLKEQLEAKGKELALIADEFLGVESLYQKNLVPITRMSALQRETARLEGERGQLRAAIAQAHGRTSEIELNILKSEQDLYGEVLRDLRETQSRIPELEERRIAAIDQLSRVDIRAPQDGIVHQRNVNTVGGVVSPGEVLMYIVPDQDDFTIEAKIPAIDRDQVFEGQTAIIRIPGLNQRKTPELTGVLTRVSPDLYNDNSPAAMSGQVPPYYTARISVTRQELSRLGSVRLSAGMPVEVHVQTGTRSALSYLLKPLRDNMSRAMAER